VKVFFKTYGCQMNIRDSEIMEELLVRSGHEIVRNLSSADVVVINTCAVRGKSENKAYSLIGRLKKRGLRVGVTGCVAEIALKDLKRRGADFVLGTRALTSIVDAIEGKVDFDMSDHLSDIKEIVTASNISGTYESVTMRTSKRHAWVNIIAGCNKFCTYCVVPYTRGREVSRPMANVIEEVKLLADSGYNQVTFLGQNVDSYGKDLKDETSLAELLRRVYKFENIERFWFLTSYPSDITDELIEVVAERPRISRNFHLPAQSGSNTILNRMNRQYTREEYIELIRKIRSKVEGATIGGDIIVGFPGESDEDFEQTLSLVKEVKYVRLNIAPYSPRQRTVASRLYSDDVPTAVKKKRMATLSKVQHAILLEMNEKLIGKSVNIIVEGKKDGKSYGRTIDNRMVFFEGDVPEGENVKVKIQHATAGPIYGELLGRVLKFVK